MKALTLAVNNPELRARPCDECRKYLYRDEPRRPISTSQKLLDHQGQPRARPVGAKPPCDYCPKKGPEHEHLFTLSEKNERALLRYLQARATCGRCLTDAETQDPVTLQYMAIIDPIIRQSETQRSAESIAAATGASIVAGLATSAAVPKGGR